jgi:hypothetical protein
MSLFLSSCVEHEVIPTADFETDFAIDYSYLQSKKVNLPKYLTYEPIKFIDKSVNGVSYSWDFGNGETSTDQQPEIEYAVSGEYNVTLIVLSETGEQAVFTQQLRIYERFINKICIEVQSWNFNLHATGDPAWTQDRVTDVVLEIGILAANETLVPSTILFTSDRIRNVSTSYGTYCRTLPNKIRLDYDLLPVLEESRSRYVVLLYAMDGDERRLFYSSEFFPGLNYYLEKETGKYKLESGTTIGLGLAFE